LDIFVDIICLGICLSSFINIIRSEEDMLKITRATVVFILTILMAVIMLCDIYAACVDTNKNNTEPTAQQVTTIQTTSDATENI
jgi:hypothetical protein